MIISLFIKRNGRHYHAGIVFEAARTPRHPTRGHNNTPSTLLLERLRQGCRAFCNRASSGGFMRNAGKRKAATPRPAAASPRATCECTVGIISLMVLALGIKTLRTASAHPPSPKAHIHGVCTQYRCPVTQATYIAFSPV